MTGKIWFINKALFIASFLFYYLCTMKFSGKKVAFHTLGCKLNFAETSGIARALYQEGFQKVDFKEKADVYVINTCSVTDNADKECKDIVKKALNTSPQAFIAVMGCYAQLKPNEIAGIPGVDLVLGASEKFKILEHLHALEKNKETAVFHCEIGDVNTFVSSYSMGDRTRTFLKVQDGCDYLCTFCTIPKARGQSRSDTIDSVLKNTIEIASKGCREVVLTGVNLGDFGYGTSIDANEGQKKLNSFLDLIQALEAKSPIERFRISSIEPNLLTNEIIEFVAHSRKFVPHFHIPLQSGSDEILKKMKRRYLSALYKEKVEKIKQLMPSASIGVDVITGFPGESDAHFMETFSFINELDVSYLHVFTYSERENTEAIQIKNPVPQTIRKQRTQMLRNLSLKKTEAFYNAHLFQSFPVLWENENKDGWMFGFTNNYIKVKTPFDVSKTNTIETFYLESFDTDGVIKGHFNPVCTE
jgi:threonylcarbamoyladenosine tRNA methylthiotransferase MtaB